MLSLSGYVNSAVVNISVQMSLWDSAFSSFGYIPRSEMAVSYSSSVCDIFEEPPCFPYKLHHFTVLQSHQTFHKSSDFSISLTTLVIICYFDCEYLFSQCLLVVFIWISQMVKDVKYLVTCLMALVYHFWRNVFSVPLDLFKMGYLIFFIVDL